MLIVLPDPGMPLLSVKKIHEHIHTHLCAKYTFIQIGASTQMNRSPIVIHTHIEHFGSFLFLISEPSPNSDRRGDLVETKSMLHLWQDSPWLGPIF